MDEDATKTPDGAETPATGAEERIAALKAEAIKARLAGKEARQKAAALQAEIDKRDAAAKAQADAQAEADGEYKRLLDEERARAAKLAEELDKAQGASLELQAHRETQIEQLTETLGAETIAALALPEDMSAAARLSALQMADKVRALHVARTPPKIETPGAPKSGAPDKPEPVETLASLLQQKAQIASTPGLSAREKIQQRAALDVKIQALRT